MIHCSVINNTFSLVYLFAVAVSVAISVLIAENTIWRYGRVREQYGVRGLVRAACGMFGRLVPK